MQLVRVLYRSHPSEDTGYAEKLEIVTDAAERNGKQDVTGFILLDDDRFLQVLEGRPATVDALLERIEKDPRHHGMEILSRSETESRLFGHWSMGFAHASQRVDEIAAAGIEDERSVDPIKLLDLLVEIARAD